MLTLLINFIIILFIMIMLITLLNLISKKSFMDREKSSPFECGFDPKSSSRSPFSLHFFLIAIIFLVFDVEITIMFPLIISMKLSNPLMFIVFSLSFIMILIIGLIHEWKQGALNWTN
uniref:NADH-ubiquinone oxidoreductase chain 3 n=1 Tax=Anaedus unidentatus TaxID=2984367 RepID=A0A978D8V3_9CUCU|nr:NADH dehydrogenase subunit 3 [Anaedus unidentatus]UYB79075.1 NADH dehydrogenase subunit 3 [Anaedus unidentatus]